MKEDRYPQLNVRMSSPFKTRLEYTAESLNCSSARVLKAAAYNFMGIDRLKQIRMMDAYDNGITLDDEDRTGEVVAMDLELAARFIRTGVMPIKKDNQSRMTTYEILEALTKGIDTLAGVGDKTLSLIEGLAADVANLKAEKI